ncbi:MAG: hypothetical protein ACR2HE_00095 [Casimicrobiaceae bacterium]
MGHLELWYRLDGDVEVLPADIAGEHDACRQHSDPGEFLNVVVDYRDRKGGAGGGAT